METFKKMRTNDIVMGQSYSVMGYSNSNVNTSYYGHNSNNNNNNNYNNYNNNNNNIRGRGGRNRGGGGRGNRGGRGNNSSHYRNSSSGSSTFFKPTMLLDPWQDLVEDMIMNNELPESERHNVYGVPMPLCQLTNSNVTNNINNNDNVNNDVNVDGDANDNNNNNNNDDDDDNDDNGYGNEFDQLLAMKRTEIAAKDTNEIDI